MKKATCTVCKEEKSTKDFTKDKRKKNGLSSLCRKCSYQSSYKSKQENTEHYRNYIREYMRSRRGYKGNGIKTYKDYLRIAGYKV